MSKLPLDDDTYDSDEDEDYVLPADAPPADENDAYLIDKSEASTTIEAPTKSVEELWSEFQQDTSASTSKMATENGQLAAASETEVDDKSAQPVNGVKQQQDTPNSHDPPQPQASSESQELSNSQATSKLPDTPKLQNSPQPAATKRKWTPSIKKSGSAMDNVLGAIKRGKKQSVLDKSQDDWNSFVDEKSLKDELDSYTRSKNSYIDNQNFLAKSDYTKFEKERDARASVRKAQ